MSAGPPPVPGGRSPDEREAARRAREARRTGRVGSPLPPPPAPEPAAYDDRDGQHDWLADDELLTARSDPEAGRGWTRRSTPSATGGRRWGRFVALTVVVLILAGAAWFANALFQPFAGDGEGSVRVRIPQGATLGDIADMLEREGVIESASFFELRARLDGRSGGLRPGPYELRQDMPYVAVLDRLEEGVPPDVVMVTIPEGRSRSEVAPIVKRLRGNYLRATRRHPALDPRDYRAPAGATLEGFLYPATYELKKGQPVRRLVREQLEAFERNFDKVDMSYARRRKLTPFDVLTIASLVEREATLARERPLIASVIYNRLRDGIRLDIDATTRFVTGNWEQPLKVSELQNPDPYNTRVHYGLPPGPIGSPGLASIKAAARPATSDYIFYVVAVCGNGKHRFAESNAEFERYVAEYEQAREERGGRSPTNC
ncbi:MAG TPA: endolytic transglycosylase MltG [Thermoleophilaceae bacterium]|nr:endolytic transglycosylase MltG [Thermoleophilaceae bacterium]